MIFVNEASCWRLQEPGLHGKLRLRSEYSFGIITDALNGLSTHFNRTVRTESQQTARGHHGGNP
jgi:hypothetical protein